MNPAFRTIFTLLLAALISTSTTSKADDFELIKERVISRLMAQDVNDESITGILATVNEDGSFQGINYDDLSREAGFPHGRHTSNLVSLAKAYNSKPSRFYNDKNILRIIAKGLKFWVEHDFVGDNWHNNQITTPTNLVNLML